MRSSKLRIIQSILLATVLLFFTPSDALAVPLQNLNGATSQTQTFQSDSNVTMTTNPATNTHSLGWFGFLPVSRGGTGADSFTAGSLFFFNGSSFAQNNSNLFWDNGNNRLGIGTSSPTSTLTVNGNTSISGNLNVAGTITSPSLSNLVPYTGATTNVNLGTHNLTANSLISTADSTINTLNIGLGASFASNTVIGNQALANSSIGERNVAVGQRALFSSQQSDSTAVGQSALGGSSNSGEQNTAVGSQTLQANTTGSQNNAFGYAALQFDTSGGSNTAMGVKAMQFNTTGSRNNAFGVGALLSNTTGVSNIAIGNGSGRYQSDGNTPLTTAVNSIYIGDEALGNDNSDSNSIVLGYNAIGAGANKTVIGNSSMTDIYFGSSSANADIHAKRLFLGSSSIPGCIIMGDTDSSGVSYLTVNDGVLTASTTPPSACQ